jgi:hypothetical protein
MLTDGVELTQTVFVHEQNEKIPHQWGRLSMLKECSHNAGFDLDIDAGVLKDPLQIHVGVQQRLMLLELLADLKNHAIAPGECH